MKLGLYRHYKGGLYLFVTSELVDGKTREARVGYYALYGEYQGLQTRLVSDVQEAVYVPERGVTVPRFEKVSDELVNQAWRAYADTRKER